MKFKMLSMREFIESLTEDELKNVLGGSGSGGSIQCTLDYCDGHFLTPYSTVICISDITEAVAHYGRCCVQKSNYKDPAIAHYTCDFSGCQ